MWYQSEVQMLQPFMFIMVLSNIKSLTLHREYSEEYIEKKQNCKTPQRHAYSRGINLWAPGPIDQSTDERIIEYDQTYMNKISEYFC